MPLTCYQGADRDQRDGRGSCDGRGDGHTHEEGRRGGRDATKEDLEKDDEEDDDDAAAQAAEAEEEEERKTFWESVQTKLKILIAVYQIQNALPWTLPYVSYPDAFEALVSWMSFIELDFVRIVPVCVEIKVHW